MSGDGSMRVALLSSGSGHVPSGIEICMLALERRLSSACRAELRAGREPVGTVSGKRLDCAAEEAAAASSTALIASEGGSEDGAEAVRARARRASGGTAVPMGTLGGAVPAFRKLESDPVLRARIALAALPFAEARYAPGPVCAALEEGLRHVSEPPVRGCR